MIDPIAPRYTALLRSETVSLHIGGVAEEKKMVAKHPKVGMMGEGEQREVGRGREEVGIDTVTADTICSISWLPSPLPLSLPPPHTRTQNAEVGEKEVWYSSTLLMEGADAQTLSVGETVTLMNWGNVVITTIDK